jgi:hypothetical protein
VIVVRHTEQEQKEYGGPQASSYEDTNIFSEQEASPGAFHPKSLSFIFGSSTLYYNLIVH